MRTKRVALVIGAIAITVALLLALSAWTLFASVRNVESTISAKIDSLFRTIDNNSFASAYGRELTPQLRTEVSMAQFVQLGDAISLRLGMLKSKTLKGCKLWQRNADTLFDVAYEAEFDKGRATIVARLKKEDGEWRFLSFRVDSPNFTVNGSQPKP